MLILTESILGWHLLLVLAALTFYLWTRRQADKKVSELHQKEIHTVWKEVEEMFDDLRRRSGEQQQNYLEKVDIIIESFTESDERLHKEFADLKMDYWDLKSKLFECKSRIRALE